jgi:hypothetical protein
MALYFVPTGISFPKIKIVLEGIIGENIYCMICKIKNNLTGKYNRSRRTHQG